MDIPEGFKQTEVGVIPCDWCVIPLGEIGDFKNGINKSKDAFGFGYPFVNLLDVFGKNLIDKSTKLELINSNELERNIYSLKRGDVIFVRSSVKPIGVGLTILIKENLPDTVFSGFLIRFRDKGMISDEFKIHCFNEEGFRKRLIANSTVSANTNINQESLKRLVIISPPTKTEQTAIATALNDTDQLITQLEQLIAKKRNIKQGAMQALLKPKEGWKEKDLGDFLDYEQPTKYLVMGTEYHNHNQIPVLTAGKSFILGYTNENFGIYTNLPVIIFDDFTTSSKFVNFKFKVKSSAIKILKQKNHLVNINFVFELMQTIKFDSTDHKRYWISEYSKIKVFVPKPEEQTQIAQILTDMDTELEALAQKLAKYRMLKQGMMQTLLTGKTRLIKPNPT